MPIDFQAPRNATTYSGRAAHSSWSAAVRLWVDVDGADVADIGCGGGTYTRAWHELGAATVVGIDFSEPILASARNSHGDLPGVRFRVGEAASTGLPDRSADLVWERALVHHVPDLAAAVAEAWRILRPGGSYLIQDRTAEDVAVPGAATHPRGWFFEVFPRLLDIERGRRPHAGSLRHALTDQGFTKVTTHQLWEVRAIHPSREEYLAEIGSRKGRSILHELDDGELDQLVGVLRRRLPAGPVEETDRWTVWQATRPT